MIKKILTVAGILLVIAILFWGAVNRTQAKNSRENLNKNRKNYSSHKIASFTSINQLESFRVQGQRGQGNRWGTYQSAPHAFNTSQESQMDEDYQPHYVNQDLERQIFTGAQHIRYRESQQRRGFGRDNRSNKCL